MHDFKIALISTSKKKKDEADIVTVLFKNGLDLFHLKKPEISRKVLIEFINQIPEEFHNRIVIHSHFSLCKKFNLKGIHLSRKKQLSNFWVRINIIILKFFRPRISISTTFHSLHSLIKDPYKYDYVFLAGVFENVAKQNYTSLYNEKQLQNSLSNSHHKVFAYGGVDAKNIQLASLVGFSGVSIYGYIWKSENDKLKNFIELKEGLYNNNQVNMKINPVKIDVKMPDSSLESHSKTG
jgi:thiamine-phosphate pyrophosphorylase